jgi:N-acetylglucosaminyl-diphospho-decaprenol L-rhamnosyltransferase
MHTPNNPDISIIVLNWNTRQLLRKCIASVYCTVSPIDIEVIVVDNNSSDGSADMVAESFPDATLIRNSKNIGFSAGNNLAIRQASGRYILLLNPDAELLPGSVQALFDFAEAHPDAAVIGPKLLNTDGSLQKNGRMFPTFAREMLHITKIYRLAPGWFNRKYEWGRADFDAATEVDEVSGACMLVRRAAIDKAGMLDERFFMYYEEVDWCLRIKKAGCKVWYLPEAQTVHHAGQGAGQIGLAKSRAAYRSQYLYFMKHHGMLKAYTLRTFSCLALLAMRIKER